MKRRQFITLLGGAATGWPLITRAQQGTRVPLVGILEGISADTPNADARYLAFLDGLRHSGWIAERDVRLELRYGGGHTTGIRKYADELIALTPAVIVAGGGAAAEEILKATKSIPIVFVIVPDPVGSGFVESLSRPAANATGFMMFEYNLCAKWPELLKQIAPNVTHAAVLRDPGTAAGIGQFAVIQSVAPSLGIDVRPLDLRGPAQIEAALAVIGQRPNGGVIVTAGVAGAANVKLIIEAVARYRLPAIYVQRPFVSAGGLISYGPNFPDQYRRAADYVIRILRGEKAADLPVQAPNRYELAINLTTAKALGISVPGRLLAQADEVIE
jgi:putative tryptophan/tyrosine transport system substrate-binding protein